jgi:hypothetical protein
MIFTTYKSDAHPVDGEITVNAQHNAPNDQRRSDLDLWHREIRVQRKGRQTAGPPADARPLRRPSRPDDAKTVEIIIAEMITAVSYPRLVRCPPPKACG